MGGTATGNLAVTGGLALIAFIVIQVHGIRDLGILGWFKHLLGGAPWWLFPIMIPVELMSLLIKPGALAIRLFANMLAGHIALKIFAGFIGLLLGGGIWALLAPLPLALTVALTALEVLVAVLQAYVFAVLTCIYLSDAVHGAH